MKFCYVIPKKFIGEVCVKAIGNLGFSKHTSTKNTEKVFNTIDNNGFYMERPHAETNAAYKQVIPCFVIYDKKRDLVLLYQRKIKHSEKRLAGLWTPIFGGHIDPSDSVSIFALKDKNGVVSSKFISTGLAREMLEETGIKLKSNMVSFKGFIFDNDNEVGTVHLGALYYLYGDLTNEVVQQINSKDEIGNVMLLQGSDIDFIITNEQDLDGNFYKLESWAKISLSNHEEIK